MVLSDSLRKSTDFKAFNYSKWSGWLPSIWFQRGIHQLAGNTARIPPWSVPRRRDASKRTVYRAEWFVHKAHQQPNYSSAFPLETASSSSDTINYIRALFISTKPLIALSLRLPEGLYPLPNARCPPTASFVFPLFALDPACELKHYWTEEAMFTRSLKVTSLHTTHGPNWSVSHPLP